MPHFADAAKFEITPLIKNVQLARDTWQLRVAVSGMARQAVPGQFFMIRLADYQDPLIGRAFALYDCNPTEGWLDLVYVVKGKLTSQLQHLTAGASIAIWGPLGNGFSVEPVDHLVLVAGGIGQTPFLAVAREALGKQEFSPTRPTGYARKVTFCYGVRSREYLAGEADFEATGCELIIATEDGSLGPARRVTTALEDVLDRAAKSDPRSTVRIATCGPEPMMEAVAKIAHSRQIACEVSLETPMACGIGICFSCVAKVGCEQDWDYKRTCVEGPVFDAATIVW